jgi:hypothetical protein
VRPGKEGEEGEKKKSGEGGVSGRLCGAPTLTVATTQPMMAVAVDELRRHGATGRRRWSPPSSLRDNASARYRFSLLDCALVSTTL